MSETKNYVEVSFKANPKYIAVGNGFQNDSITVDISTNSMINPPENVDRLKTIIWNKLRPEQTCLIFDGAIDEGGSNLLLFGEEKYNDWVQPFVEVWQAEKDRIEQEQAEAEAEYNKFENRKARALTQLNADFETVAERAYIVSSLGFTVDANGTANENVNGLLITIGTGTVQFCDYYNQFHELNKAQLEALQSEIVQNGQSLYAQKWQYRHAIEDCIDNEGLDAVLATIEFTYMDFTPTGEGETETGEQA